MAKADVAVISYREKKCFRRTEMKVTLYGAGDIEFPRSLSSKEREWVDECTNVGALGATDNDGRFQTAVRARRWYVVKINWGELLEPKRALLCKVHAWGVTAYSADTTSNRLWVDAQTGPFFLQALERKELVLELAKPIGKEGRCRTFLSSESALP